ncbi:MAG: hypothetical protein OXC58_09525 [Acidimicrobiaceae bacterium]|nr:hypothetical protein [Acidimicrobiaceae bacterium]MCY4295056.1 hypothetical protein [Acidimicrobiaceae bacterium]
MLLNEFVHRSPDERLQLQRVDAPLGHEIEEQVTHAGGAFVASEKARRTNRSDDLRKSVGDQMMLFRTLLGDDRLDQSPKALLVTAVLGVNQINQQIRARHD